MKYSVLITIVLLISISFAYAIEVDYCIADPTLPHGSSGYSCKDPSKVTTDDFYYSGLRTPSNTSNFFKFGVGYASVAQFPALNGMGVSMVRADFEIGGATPIHFHRATELILVDSGTLFAGFIDTNNKPYTKTLEAGDMFVIPPSLEHFVINVGNSKAVVYAAFDSPNPGIQTVTLSLFRNELPTDVISRVTLLDPAQILKLKKALGGTN